MTTASTVIKAMPSATFTNEHGEKFVIHTNGISVFMSGDEVSTMVAPKRYPVIAGKYIPLFNEAFSIWSADELNKLGKALQEVTEDIK